MGFDSRFSHIWKRAEEFEFSLPDGQPRLCIFAQAFSEWVETLNQDIVTRTPTVVSVNQAKVLLIDKYFSFRNIVPKSHRNRIGEVGHTCIFHVFQQAYGDLRTIELALVPPLLFLPPEPPAPPGLYLGDFVDE